MAEILAALECPIICEYRDNFWRLYTDASPSTVLAFSNPEQARAAYTRLRDKWLSERLP